MANPTRPRLSFTLKLFATVYIGFGVAMFLIGVLIGLIQYG